MALRFSLPEHIRLPADDRSLVRLPAMREPKNLEYRSHEDINGLHAILQSSHCKILGKTAVGKSSVLPKLLSIHGQCTVLIVTAHPLLACSGYEFFENNPRHGVDGSYLHATLLRDQETDISKFDLVWSSAAQLAAWLMPRTTGAVHNNKPLTDMVVLLDEAHECDAYTHVIRTMSLHLGARTLALVSATFEPAGHTVNPNNIRVSKYPEQERPETWDVLEPGKPWYHNNMKDATIMFVDSGSTAARLGKNLNDIGYITHRLTSKSTYQEYKQAVGDLNNPKNPPVVLILDRSYRSGFNFDVSVIIDSGIMYYVDGEMGTFAYKSRGIYNVEYVQSAGRGGRFGRTTVYYGPDVSYPTRICDLEPVEKEAAALVTRLLGYYPVRETADSVMTHDNLPSNQPLLAAINGAVPLSYYCRDEFGTRKRGVRPVEPPKVVIVPASHVSSKVPTVVGRRLSATVESVVGTSVAGGRPAIKQPSVVVGGAASAVSSVAQRAPSIKATDANALTRVGRVDVPQSSVSVGKPSILSRTVAHLGERELRRRGAPSMVSSVSGGHLGPGDSVSVVGSKSVAKKRLPVNKQSSSTIEIPRDEQSQAGHSIGYAETTLTDTQVSENSGGGNIWKQIIDGLNTVSSREPPSENAYLHVESIPVERIPQYSRFFPLGLESVMQLFADDKLRNLSAGISARHKEYAILNAVQRYNVLTLELRSLQEAVRVVFSGCPNVFANSSIKKRVLRIINHATQWEMERATLKAAVGQLIGKDYYLTELTTAAPSESARMLLYERKLRAIRDRASSDTVEQLDAWLGTNNVLGPLLISSKRSSSRDVVRASNGRSAGATNTRTVYVKPCLGISQMTEQPNGTVDVKPSRMVRSLTGIGQFTVSDVQVNRRDSRR